MLRGLSTPLTLATICSAYCPLGRFGTVVAVQTAPGPAIVEFEAPVTGTPTSVAVAVQKNVVPAVSTPSASPNTC